MTPKLKKIILILVLILIMFIIYAVFIKKDPAQESLVGAPTPSANNAQMLGNQISQALLRIEQIKLDKSIFSDAIYLTLVDRSEPISEEPIGRPNPFAPIGNISLNSNTRTSTSTAPADN